jgi:replicative DNA helicase
MRARARKQRRRRGLDLIVIDYLQLMLSDKTRPENRVQEVSAISRGLKSLAKEMNVPVIALAQLNRQVEARDDKRPILSDLRDSGSIEQDADVVMFVFREEEYVSRAEPRRSACKDDEQHNDLHDAWSRRMAACRGIAEILIRKNRHGATRSIKTHFNAELTRFENLAWTP